VVHGQAHPLLQHHGTGRLQHVDIQGLVHLTDLIF
jgi:hypothetical protein